MCTSTQLKHEFLKKWAMGLQTYSASEKGMSILERKKAIKLSADVAMASTRTPTTFWSRALIANASKDAKNKTLIEHVLGKTAVEGLNKSSIGSVTYSKRVRTKKILKRSSCSARKVKKLAPHKVLATSIAKRLVKKRTQLLKRLVPGGESMDEFSLIKETLDYILSLRVQVDIMRRLANASQHLNHI